MSAQTIKGITVVIDGDVTKLDKALKDVIDRSADTQSELTKVNRLLKFDPTNTELLAQKQDLLKDRISQTSEKLKILNDTQADVKKQFEAGEIDSGQYRAFKREIEDTNIGLKNLEAQARKANGELSSDKAISNLKNMGKAVAIGAGAAVVAIGAVAVAAIGAADELQRQSDVTGISVERLQELQYAGNKLGVELDTITGAQAKLTKSMLSGKDGTGAQADAFKQLKVDVTNSDGSLRDSKVVMEEAFSALGKVGNETERDALAMTIFGKSAMDLNPLIKAGGEELSNLSTEARNNGAVMSVDAVKGLDDFGDGIDSMKQSITSIIGEALSKLMPYINDLIKGLSELPAWIEKNQTLVILIAIAIGTLIAAFIAFNIAAAFTVIGVNGMTAAATAFAGVMAFITSPVTLVVLAIGALIAIGVLLWKNWDVISAKAKEIFGGIGTFTGNIFDGIGKGAKSMANGVIDGLNAMIRALNKLKFNVPSWVPIIGGSKFGFDIPSVPYLDVGTNYVARSGYAYIHEGEAVVPKKYNPQQGGGTINANITLEVPLNGRILARETFNISGDYQGLQVKRLKGAM